MVARAELAAVGLVVGALGLGAHFLCPHRASFSKSPRRVCIAGWLLMFRLVLLKIPMVRALCDLPELPKEDSPDRKRL